MVIALISVMFFGSYISAESTEFEKVTWDQLENENFDIESITDDDVQKADDLAESLNHLFKEDEDGFAAMDIQAIEDEYGEDIANVYKVGMANINLDIENGVTEFAPDHKSFIKGPNYDEYVNEDEDDNSGEGNISLMACTAKEANKAIVGGAVGGAVTGAVGGGVGAAPGGAIGGAAGGASYYATCWW